MLGWPEALARLRTNEHGGVSAEYLVVLSLVAIGACAAIATLAALLIRLFVYQQARLALPFP